MSDDEAAFMRAILAEPDDDAPRLVFADWLDEHGQPERAEYIRLTCGGDRVRTAELWTTHHEAWKAHLPQPFASHWQFDRGLPTTLHLFSASSTNEPAVTEALCLISTCIVRVTHLDQLGPLFDRPDLGTVQRLVLDHWRTSEPANWPVHLGPAIGRHLWQLTLLNLCGQPLGNHGLNLLLDGADVSRLAEFNLSATQLGDDGAIRLAGLHFPNLRQLDLSDNHIGDLGAVALARSPNFPRLRRLVLNGNPVGEAGADALAGTFHLTHPEAIELSGSDLSANPSVTSGVVRQVDRRDESRSSSEPDQGIVLSRPPRVRLWLSLPTRSSFAVPTALAVLLWPVIGVLRGLTPALWALVVYGLTEIKQPKPIEVPVLLLCISAMLGATAGMVQCIEPILTQLAASRWRSLVGIGLAVSGGSLVIGEAGLWAAALGVLLAWLSVTLGAVGWTRLIDWPRRHRDRWLFVLAEALRFLVWGGIAFIDCPTERITARWLSRVDGQAWNGLGLFALPIISGAVAGLVGGMMNGDATSGAWLGAALGVVTTLVLGGVAPDYQQHQPAVAVLDHEAYLTTLATAGASALAFTLAWHGGLLGLASAPWSAWLSLAGVFLAAAVGSAVAVGKPTHLFRQMRTAIRHRQRLWG